MYSGSKKSTVNILAQCYSHSFTLGDIFHMLKMRTAVNFEEQSKTCQDKCLLICVKEGDACGNRTSLLRVPDRGPCVIFIILPLRVPGAVSFNKVRACYSSIYIIYITEQLNF
jgi:hypothetical protein